MRAILRIEWAPRTKRNTGRWEAVAADRRLRRRVPVGAGHLFTYGRGDALQAGKRPVPGVHGIGGGSEPPFGYGEEGGRGYPLPSFVRSHKPLARPL